MVSKGKTVIETYPDGQVCFLKTCRKDKICEDCGKIITKGTLLQEIAHLVVFRKSYYQGNTWFCTDCKAKPKEDPLNLKRFGLKVGVF